MFKRREDVKSLIAGLIFLSQKVLSSAFKTFGLTEDIWVTDVLATTDSMMTGEERRGDLTGAGSKVLCVPMGVKPNVSFSVSIMLLIELRIVLYSVFASSNYVVAFTKVVFASVNRMRAFIKSFISIKNPFFLSVAITSQPL